jgi:hypothetical protein
MHAASSDDVKSPRIGVVMLQCGEKEAMLEDCVRTLEAQTWRDFKVWLVVNGDKSGNAERVAERHPELELIRLEENRGWSGGNNAGIRAALAAGAEWVWLLNNDTLLEADCVERMMEHVATHPGAKVLSPLILDTQTPPDIAFQGGKIDFKNYEIRDCGSLEEFLNLKTPEYPYIMGCAMLIHRDVFAKIGIIDERFFLYCEDSDFSWRALEAGFGLAVVPEAKLRHLGGQHTGGFQSISPFRIYHTFRGGWLFWKKRLGFLEFHTRFVRAYLSKRFVDGQNSRHPQVLQAQCQALWACLRHKWGRGQLLECPGWFRKFAERKAWVLVALLGWDFRTLWSGLLKQLCGRGN